MNHKFTALLVLAAVASIFLFQMKPHHHHNSEFKQWKSLHGKVYDTEVEEKYREQIFNENVAKINAHNADNSQTYQMGLTQFADLSQEEFAGLYLTLKAKKLENTRTMNDRVEITNDIDWVTQGKVTGVKNQGQCGSCWAFSATAAIESRYLVADRASVNLSEQQLVDCSRAYGNYGCNGGWMDSAFQYVKEHGLVTTAEYPYVARDQTCKIDNGPHKISGFIDVPGCANLMNALNVTPISVAVDASNWSLYRSGIFSNCGTAVNHGVLLVGLTDAYWTIKNSWASSWGEIGFIRLAPGNTCAVCSYPSYPTL